MVSASSTEWSEWSGGLECFLECGIPDREQKLRRDDETGTASVCLENCKRRSVWPESTDDEGPDKIEIDG